MSLNKMFVLLVISKVFLYIVNMGWHSGLWFCKIYIFHSAIAKKEVRTPMSILVLGSSSGLLTCALWDVAIQAFFNVVQKCLSIPSKEIVLLTDNLGIHCQLDSIKKALESDYYQIYFLPNCSHFIQPLDDILFANLKHQAYSISSSILHQHFFWDATTLNLQKIVIDAVMESFPIVFTLWNIKRAWDHVGVDPLQPEKILEQCH